MGGILSMFGSASDKSSTTNTTNQTFDYTRSNTDNVEGSFNTSDSRIFNTALTRNQSAITNDTRIQNTALQLTDAFNRFVTNNLANVGNTNIGASGTSADDTAKLLLAFQGLQPPRGLNDATPDLTKGLLDFNTLSKIATDNIKASGAVSKDVFSGFTDTIKATGSNLAAADTTSGTIRLALIGAIVLGALWLIFRKR